jgi:DNA-binding MarR family transcriptional regulator
MADMVRRLIKKDLLQRLRAEKDRRAYSVSLTAKGHRDLSSALRVASGVEQALLVALLDAEMAQFLRILRCVVDDMNSTAA